MEIPSYDNTKTTHDPLELNNKIQKYYLPISMYSRDVTTKNDKRFIASIYHNNEMILLGTYIILGSYSKEKNVWVWGNRSIIMNKSMKHEISNIRSVLADTIDNEKIKKFVKADLTVLPTNELCENLSYLSYVLVDQSKNIDKDKYNFFTISFHDMMDVLIIKKVLADNMKQ